MKKRAIILMWLTAISLFAAGCGKKTESDPPAHMTTAEQSPDAGKPASNVVEMEEVEEVEDELPFIGTASESAMKIVLTNQTGAEISYLFIRDNDSEDWGEERIRESLILNEGAKAILYVEPMAEAEAYDIRIGFTDYDKSECFFRKLPMSLMKEITLCMDGTGEEAIPFARYKTTESKKEYSTLLEVKVRLGILTEEEAQALEAEDEQVEFEMEEERSAVDIREDAESCIGKALSVLTSLCGEPRKTTYKNEPETGQTGLHEYTDFTVYTTVEEDGNEIVAGIW